MKYVRIPPYNRAKGHVCKDRTIILRSGQLKRFDSPKWYEVEDHVADLLKDQYQLAGDQNSRPCFEIVDSYEQAKQIVRLEQIATMGRTQREPVQSMHSEVESFGQSREMHDLNSPRLVHDLQLPREEVMELEQAEVPLPAEPMELPSLDGVEGAPESPIAEPPEPTPPPESVPAPEPTPEAKPAPKRRARRKPGPKPGSRRKKKVSK